MKKTLAIVLLLFCFGPAICLANQYIDNLVTSLDPEGTAIQMVKTWQPPGSFITEEQQIQNYLSTIKGNLQVGGWQARKVDDKTYLVSFTYSTDAGPFQYNFEVNINAKIVRAITADDPQLMQKYGMQPSMVDPHEGPLTQLPSSDTNIFLKVVTDKTSTSLNEKIKVSYTLYTRYDTRYDGFQTAGNFNGFRAELIPITKDVPRENVDVNGIKYIAAVIQEINIFPISTGDLLIEPGSIKVTIRGEDDAVRRNIIPSKPIVIHVK